MSERPYATGALAGAGAWLLGYLTTFLLTGSRVRDSGLRRAIELFGGELPTWKVVGWVFYNAHFVETRFEGIFGGTASFVGGEDGFTLLLYVVPPALLLAAGLAVGRRAGAETLDTANAAVTGATVSLGYAPLAVVGLFLFGVEGAAPVVATGILLAAVFYPVVFGAAGGGVAALTGRD
ncbi:hypothetical protein [Natronomonas sp. EA1]|uniref:hypothetical protein n=1 Tax=Natronomonas sp. EA1 TaxID=3421655 RepID=UPI003EBDA78A